MNDLRVNPIPTMSEDELELQSIIATLDVPMFRKKDYNWLARNLAIRNSTNPNFEKAIELVEKIASQQIVKRRA